MNIHQIDYKISNEAFEDRQSETLFMDRVLEEIKRASVLGISHFIFNHPDISKTIEKLIEILNSDQIEAILSMMLPTICELVQSPCASHVVQCALSMLNREKGPNGIVADSTSSQLLTQLIHHLKAFGLSSLLLNERSTFVVRDLLWITSGAGRLDVVSKTNRLSLHNVRNMHKEGTVRTQFDGFADNVAMAMIESESIRFNHSDKKQTRILCGSLCVLVQCLFITESREMLQRVIDQILTATPSKQKKSPKKRSMEHLNQCLYQCSHLMQSVFECGDDTVTVELITNHLDVEEIRRMANHKEGNFVLQSMLRRVFDALSIEKVGSALKDTVADLMCNNRTGVLVQLLDAFGRTSLNPSFIVKAILSMMENDSKFGEGNIVEKFLRLNMSQKALNSKLLQSRFRPRTSKFSVPGCMLLSAILKSNSSSLESLCRSFLSLESEDIVRMTKDSSGSMAVQSFIESKYIGDAFKHKLIDSKLEGKLAFLCTDKYGGFVMEAAFFGMGMERRKQFVLKILRRESVLKGSKIGLLLFSKMKLDLFKSNQEEWIQFLSGKRIQSKQPQLSPTKVLKKQTTRNNTKTHSRRRVSTKKSVASPGSKRFAKKRIRRKSKKLL